MLAEGRAVLLSAVATAAASGSISLDAKDQLKLGDWSPRHAAFAPGRDAEALVYGEDGNCKCVVVGSDGALAVQEGKTSDDRVAVVKASGALMAMCALDIGLYIRTYIYIYTYIYLYINYVHI